jgi:hypothetical protein
MAEKTDSEIHDDKLKQEIIQYIKENLRLEDSKEFGFSITPNYHTITLKLGDYNLGTIYI